MSDGVFILTDTAVFASAAVVIAGSLLLYIHGRRNRLREAGLVSERAELASAYQEVAAAKQRAEAESAHLQSIMSGMSDGVMMLNNDLTLVL